MATYAPDPPRISPERFASIPSDDRWRVELADGRLVREPRPAALHGVVVAHVYDLLRAHVEVHGLGRVVLETGFLLPGARDTVRGPDVGFIGGDRLPTTVPRTGWWELAPTLAVEVVSPRDQWNTVQGKVADYLTAGSSVVWVLDPVGLRVLVYEAGGAVRSLGRDDHLDGGAALPGFRVQVADLLRVD
ncbi:MAG: Uma2 family endonuclease [Gemmatimonadota bacterium]